MNSKFWAQGFSRTAHILALSLCVLLVMSGMAMAQTSLGSITGVVTDPSGAVVPEATVKLTQKSTGAERETKTNSAGVYRFDALVLGAYDVAVSATGFSSSKVDTVQVLAGREMAVDVALKVGAAADTVTIEGAGAVALQTTEQVRGGSIPAQSVANLPVIGQNSLNLMLTLPGIAASGQGGSLDSGIGSVNGSRARSNNFMIDGADNNDISVAGPAFVITNTDAIQEVSIQTSNFSAEFGRSGGAILNQVTKSGTNDIHGTAAFVYRSQVLNASNRTQRRLWAGPASGDPLKSVFHEMIPAFTVGGPVWLPKLYDGRNKTFWFVAGQWDRFSSGGSLAEYTVPTEAGFQVLSALAASCPNVQQYLAVLGSARAASADNNINISVPASTLAAAPTCNGTDRAGQTVGVGAVSIAAPTKFLDNNHQIRIDHIISNKQNILGRWLWDDIIDSPTQIGHVPEFNIDGKFRTLGGTFNHNYIFNNSWTNEFRFNYSRFNYGWFLDEGSLAATLPQINVTGLSTLGISATFPQGRIANSYQYSDTVSWVKGKHQVRFGVDIMRQLAKQVAPFNGRGSITFARVTGATPSESMANWIDNYGGSSSNIVSKTFGSGLYRPNLFRWTLFVQDSWKVSQNLTVNAGLRYENFGQPANIFKYPSASLDPAQPLTLGKVNPDNNNFGPSLGFAYTPRHESGILGRLTGDGRMVIRGGYQVSYDTWYNNLLSNMTAGVPNAIGNAAVVSSVTASNPRGIPNAMSFMTNVAPAPLAAINDMTSQFEKDIRNPYTHRFSLGIQRELPGRMVMDVSYVGSLSRQLFHTVNWNPRTPPASGLTANGPRINPLLGLRQPRVSGANSNYNSLQAQLRKQFSETPLGGITFDMNYTWSRNMDTQSETFGTNSSPQNPSRSYFIPGVSQNIDYGPSDNDRRHIFNTVFRYQPRAPKSGVLGQIIGGWEFAGIIPIVSGTPFTPINGLDRDMDGSTLGDRPDVGNWNADRTTRGIYVPTTTCATGIQAIPSSGGCVTANDVFLIAVPGRIGTTDPVNFPGANTLRRNALYTPGAILVHLNILKTVKITERMKFEYRAEIFNLMNHMNDNVTPGTRTVTSTSTAYLNPAFSNSGTSTTVASRTMRMGVKLIF